MSTPASATTISIPVEDIKEWRGEDVVDLHGDKLGKLEEVYYDTETDAPAFAAVKSGLFGKRLTLVPLAGATAARSHVRVRAAKDEFKEAPSFDPDAELGPEDEASTYRYYGLEYLPVGQGARRLAKH
jgi:hypothetical protein